MTTYDKVVDYLYSQVNAKYKHSNIYSGIVDRRKGTRALHMADQFYDRDSSKYNKSVTDGWDLEVEWKGGLKYWLNISVLNNDNPLEVERYEVGINIGDEPPFDWWDQ